MKVCEHEGRIQRETSYRQADRQIKMIRMALSKSAPTLQIRAFITQPS